MVHDSLVYQSSSSTVAEAVIQRTIEGIQMLMVPQYNKNISQRLRDKEEEGQSAVASSSSSSSSSSVIEINPAAKRHWKLQIQILQDSPRDADKLKATLKMKEKEYEKATDSEEIERLVTEIEMFTFLLFLVMRRENFSQDHHLHQRPHHHPHHHHLLQCGVQDNRHQKIF